MSALLTKQTSKVFRLNRALFAISNANRNSPITDRQTDCSSIIECRRSVTTSSDDARRSLVGPTARILLHHYGIEETHIKASGPHNVIMKSDVLEYIKQKNLKPGASAPSSASASVPTRKATPFVRKEKFNDTELSNMRRTIAKRLTQSKTTIPHSYMSAECCVGNILKMRKRMEKDKIKVSVNDFVIKAAAIALKRVSAVNVMIDESRNVIKTLPNVDISIAVATKSGLITPIIKDANKLSVVEINENVKQLANKAREGKLQPHEFQGGTFSISNLGMFGISEFSAVINPPQSAILAIGSSRLTADEDGEISQKMTVTMSYDARAVNEEACAKFLEAFKDLMENPKTLEKAGDGSDLRRLSYLSY